MRDDSVPEEEDQIYTHLLAALRAAGPQPEPISTAEQAEIIARVRERLTGATDASASTSPKLSTPPTHRLFAPALPTKHTVLPLRWSARLLVALGALLLILASSWALFKASPFSHGVTGVSMPTKPPPSAQAEANGLEASMQVLIDGPYFLGELLPIDVSLTNRTDQTVTMPGIKTTATLCHDSALMVKVTAGSEPSLAFPKIDIACDQVLPMTEVKPGETLTIHQYVPLTKSAAVTLTMQSDAADTPIPFAPLAGHWPSVQIQVQPQVPDNRALTLGILQSLPPQIIVHTPAGTQPQLLYMQSISCKDYFDGSGDHWMPLQTNILHQPACPGAHPHWQYIVSAPGYSIVSGSQQG